MPRLPLRASNVIQNRVSVIHAGHVYMYCYVDGDEEEIADVILQDVSRGKLHPFAGGMLRYLIRSDGTEATD
jgi:hypothetical protein